MADGWFAVDKAGLAKLVRARGDKGLAFVIFELVQNAWDSAATRCDVLMEPIEGRPMIRVTVRDDDPDGFRDLRHAFTLFAESDKKSQAEKRGRFNLGEKLVLSVCETAVISSTKGTVTFDADGRKSLRRCTERGSEFVGCLRMTRQQMTEIEQAVRLLIAPIPTTFNGTELRRRAPLVSAKVTLPTVHADAEGQLRPTRRATTIDLYEPLEGEPARLYELGIPVCEIGDRWDVDVQQKVPLPMDRDSVTEGYLREIRLAVFNAAADRLTAEDARATWVQVATNHPNARPENVLAVTKQRFGERFVDYDPTDIEANGTATSHGNAVIGCNALGKQERKHLRSIGAIQPAGKVYPTHPTALAEAHELEPELLTEQVRLLLGMYARLAARLVEHPVTITIHSAPDAGTIADYSAKTSAMRLNYPRLGATWFERPQGRPTAEQLDLLVHELGHDYEGDHTSARYHNALTKLAGRLARLALTEPELF